MSWWEVFAPLWVEVALNSLMILSNCGNIKTEEELSGLSVEQRAKEDTVGTLIFKLVAQGAWLACLVLLCVKLTHPSTFPAWIMFVPLFAFVGCFCCCVS